MLLCQQFYQFLYTNIFFRKKLGPMQKSLDSSEKNYSFNGSINRKYDPILIEDYHTPSYQTKDYRRLTYQREDSNQRDRIPQFLKQMELPKTTYKKTPQYSETTKSLIVSQKERRFRQSKDSKYNYMTASNKNPAYTDGTYYPKDCSFSTKKQKNPAQNLTFDNFLEMAKRQKDRNIPTYTFMCSPKPTRLPYKTKPYIFQQLRQTEDTIPDNLIFLENHSPKVTDFHQVRLLGKGKNGEVYLAIHKSTGFACAMKIIKKKDINRGTTAERQIMYNQLLRQIKIQMYLSHPNLIELYCVFCDKQNIYLIQQLGINGQLYELMRKKDRLSEESTALISREILCGLKAMHQKNIIHRDIKPQNIVLVYGIAKICDFGWSVYCPVELRSTLCGTPLYLSPQVLIGEEYNYKIDIWAYGTLVYELFTGDNPFKIKNKSDMKKIVTDDLVFAQTFPRRLRSFLQLILNKNSSQRPQAKQIQKHEFLRKYAELQTSDELANI